MVCVYLGFSKDAVFYRRQWNLISLLFLFCYQIIGNKPGNDRLFRVDAGIVSAQNVFGQMAHLLSGFSFRFWGGEYTADPVEMARYSRRKVRVAFLSGPKRL